MTIIGGDVAPGFERVAEAFQANFDEGAELGAGFAAIVDGEIVVNLFGGHLDRGLERAWTRDTLAPVHSTTKGIAAIVIARLVDDGLISYDDLVTQIWPEFGAHGKGALSIGQALSHQSGLAGFADPIDQKLWLDPPALAAKLADAAPLWPPGTASGYHPLTWGYIVGEIARRAAGRSLGAILSEDICAPLGADFRLGLADSDAHRCATMQKPKRIADFGELTPIKRAAFLQPWSNSAARRSAMAPRRNSIRKRTRHGAFSRATLQRVRQRRRQGAVARGVSRTDLTADRRRRSRHSLPSRLARGRDGQCAGVLRTQSRRLRSFRLGRIVRVWRPNAPRVRWLRHEQAIAFHHGRSAVTAPDRSAVFMPRLTRRFYEIGALLIAAMLLAVMGWRLAHANGLPLAEGQPVFGDFIAFWSAGRLALEGRAAEVHNEAAIYAQHLIAVPGLHVVAPWNSPPPFLLISSLFALTPFPVAALLFLLLSGALYLYVARKTLPDARALLFALTLPAALFHLGSVQTGLLIAGVSGLALLWIDKRPRAAGALIALLAIKPHLAILWPVFLIISKRWTAFITAALATTAFLVIAGFVFGFESYARFFDNLRAAQSLIGDERVATDTFASYLSPSPA